MPAWLTHRNFITAALLEERHTPRIERERTADEDHEKRQNENAAPPIVGEGMDRGEHARSDRKGSNQGQRNGQDLQQNGPDLERAAFFHYYRGIQQRRAGEPRRDSARADDRHRALDQGKPTLLHRVSLISAMTDLSWLFATSAMTLPRVS